MPCCLCLLAGLPEAVSLPHTACMLHPPLLLGSNSQCSKEPCCSAQFICDMLVTVLPTLGAGPKRLMGCHEQNCTICFADLRSASTGDGIDHFGWVGWRASTVTVVTQRCGMTGCNRGLIALPVWHTIMPSKASACSFVLRRLLWCCWRHSGKNWRTCAAALGVLAI